MMSGALLGKILSWGLLECCLGLLIAVQESQVEAELPFWEGGGRGFRRKRIHICLLLLLLLLSHFSHVTLCDPIDGSPPGSAVPGILQAKTLEWVAISFSNA